ncbi:unnamed protein product, partial [Prorocentrum cordatum]
SGARAPAERHAPGGVGRSLYPRSPAAPPRRSRQRPGTAGAAHSLRGTALNENEVAQLLKRLVSQGWTIDKCVKGLLQGARHGLRVLGDRKLDLEAVRCGVGLWLAQRKEDSSVLRAVQEGLGDEGAILSCAAQTTRSREAGGEALAEGPCREWAPRGRPACWTRVPRCRRVAARGRLVAVPWFRRAAARRRFVGAPKLRRAVARERPWEPPARSVCLVWFVVVPPGARLVPGRCPVGAGVVGASWRCRVAQKSHRAVLTVSVPPVPLPALPAAREGVAPGADEAACVPASTDGGLLPGGGASRAAICGRLGATPFLPHTHELFMHGRGYDGPVKPPKVLWKSASPPRQDHSCPEWLTATEFEDLPDVADAKAAQLALLLLCSKKTVAYTGAGISASVVGQAALSGQNKVGWVGNPREAQPTPTHYILSFLARQGLLHGWVQQNHDGLPQKAGFPQENINEIHGSWYDPSNPVVKYSGSLHDRSFAWMEDDANTADLCLVLGTSLGGLNADQLPVKTARRSVDAVSDDLAEKDRRRRPRRIRARRRRPRAGDPLPWRRRRAGHGDHEFAADGPGWEDDSQDVREIRRHPPHAALEAWRQHGSPAPPQLAQRFPCPGALRRRRSAPPHARR